MKKGQKRCYTCGRRMKMKLSRVTPIDEKPFCKKCHSKPEDARESERALRLSRRRNRLAARRRPKKVKKFSGEIYTHPDSERGKSLNALGFSDYATYLRSPLWSDLRIQTLTRDSGLCLACGGAASQIHHKDYSLDTMTGKNLDGLASLCRRCHEGIEFGYTERSGETVFGKRFLAEANAELESLMSARRCVAA